MVLNGEARVPGFRSEPASGPREETFTKKIGLATGTHGFDACVGLLASTVAVPMQMSSPALHPNMGGDRSQKLPMAEIAMAVGAAALRSLCVLQESTFPPALPPVEVEPRSPPATSYSTPTPLPVMTLFSTLPPTPPLTKARPEPAPLST